MGILNNLSRRLSRRKANPTRVVSGAATILNDGTQGGTLQTGTQPVATDTDSVVYFGVPYWGWNYYWQPSYFYQPYIPYAPGTRVSEPYWVAGIGWVRKVYPLGSHPYLVRV